MYSSNKLDKRKITNNYSPMEVINILETPQNKGSFDNEKVMLKEPNILLFH